MGVVPGFGLLTLPGIVPPGLASFTGVGVSIGDTDGEILAPGATDGVGDAGASVLLLVFTLTFVVAELFTTIAKFELLELDAPHATRAAAMASALKSKIILSIYKNNL